MHLSALHAKKDWGFLVLRLIVAGIFLYHGYQKWAMWAPSDGQTPAMMLNLMRFLSIAEPLAGIALILGLLTQIASIGLVLVMISAIYVKITMFKLGFANGWELDLAILGSVFVLALNGAGRYSLDAMLMKKKS